VVGVDKATLRYPVLVGRRMPFVCFPFPEKMRGAERRQALVRNAAPDGPVSRADPSPDRRRWPAHDAGRRVSRRPAAAFARPFRLWLNCGPRFAVPVMKPGPLASSSHRGRIAPRACPAAARV